MFYGYGMAAGIKTGRKPVRTQQVFMLCLLLTCATLSSAESSASADQAGYNQDGYDQTSYKFPQWPVRKQLVREMVPPPPPGPYMSTALSDFTVKGPVFKLDIEKYESRHSSRHEAQNVESKTDITGKQVMDVFSPDRPWPKSSASRSAFAPSRWLPENGYRFVSPEAHHLRQAETPYRRARMPDSSYLPNMSGSAPRWLPGMGRVPAETDFAAPSYRQNYPPIVTRSGK